MAEDIELITAVVNPTTFIESYQNRIKEDVYDSLEGQPDFVYVAFGPSRLNT